MAVVFDNLLHPGQGQVGYNVRQRVDVYLVASAADSSAPGHSIDGVHLLTFIDKFTEYANGAGNVTFDLWPNTSDVMSPANTYYAWATHLQDGRVNWRYFRVPNTAGPFWVENLLIASPDPLQAAFGPAAASVLRTTAQSVPNNTTTSVSFGAAEYQSGDTPLWTAGAPTRLTAPVAGEYMMGGSTRFVANATGTRFFQLIISGNYNLTQIESLGSASIAASCSLTGFHYLNAGDFLELKVTQTSGGALNMDDYGFDDVIRMWMKRVG